MTRPEDVTNAPANMRKNPTTPRGGILGPRNGQNWPLLAGRVRTADPDDRFVSAASALAGNIDVDGSESLPEQTAVAQ
jgi:hypothetical protein